MKLVVLILIQSIYTYGFSLHSPDDCADFTVGDCTISEDSIINQFPTDDVPMCQEVCRQLSSCMLFSHDGLTCSLLSQEYRKACGNVGAPVDTDMDHCEDAIVESCSGFDEENCEYLGESVGVDLPDGEISDPLVCQAMCNTFSGLGCTFWVYKDKPQSCQLLKSSARSCTGISGPRAPPIDDCRKDTCEESLCLSTDGCSLVIDSLLTTLPQLNKVFFISFEFQATEYIPGWQSVIHFTEGGDCCEVGQRVPALWVENSGYLHLSFAVDGNGNYYNTTEKQYSLNEWHSVEFSQSLKNGKYIYRAVIDGEDVIGPLENKDPKTFSNVKVYAADPWFNSLKGSIRNLLINTDSSNGCEAKTANAIDNNAINNNAMGGVLV